MAHHSWVVLTTTATGSEICHPSAAPRLVVTVLKYALLFLYCGCSNIRRQFVAFPFFGIWLLEWKRDAQGPIHGLQCTSMHYSSSYITGTRYHNLFVLSLSIVSHILNTYIPFQSCVVNTAEIILQNYGVNAYQRCMLNRRTLTL